MKAQEAANSELEPKSRDIPTIRRNAGAVVIASEFFGEESSATAFARRSMSLARELSNLGHAVHVVTSEVKSIDTAQFRFRVTRVVPLRSARIIKDNLLSRVAGSAIYAFRFLSILAHERPGIVITVFHYPLANFLSVLDARLRCATSVVDAQDSWVYSEHSHPGRARNRVRKILEAQAMKLADRVTTVTPTLRGLLAVSYRVPQSRIAVVYNGADPIPFDDTGPKDIDMIHLGSPRFYYDTIGFLSALSSPKFRELKPRVVFLGCTEEPYVQDVHDKIGALGLKGLVQMLPPVPPREVRHWLARAKAGVFTLSHEPIYKAAIGLKVFEYLASGLPVLHLGPSDGETARLIMRTQSGLVSETAEEFASNYLRFHADPALEATLSAAARSAGRTYTWAASGKAMADTLRGIRQPANDGWRSPERDPERMCARGGPGS